MKYNPNRYRGVDPRLLGQLLDTDAVVGTCGTGCGGGISNMRNSQSNGGCVNSPNGNDALNSACPTGASLAMVYSPYQSWRELYTLDVALAKGTLFSELDLPLEAINCRRGC